jgi:hypothetical protein
MDWKTRRNETPGELNLSQGASGTQANASVAQSGILGGDLLLGPRVPSPAVGRRHIVLLE